MIVLSKISVSPDEIMRLSAQIKNAGSNLENKHNIIKDNESTLKGSRHAVRVIDTLNDMSEGLSRMIDSYSQALESLAQSFKNVDSENAQRFK